MSFEQWHSSDTRQIADDDRFCCTEQRIVRDAIRIILPWERTIAMLS